jgi:DNA mismatch repair protein MutS
MTLFATHYFELTTLATEIDGIANVHLEAAEHHDGIVFLHAVKDGPANRSYGLAVAQLAGVPREVIIRARDYLAALEAPGLHGGGNANPRQTELALSEPAVALPTTADRVALELGDINPDALSPRQALDALYRLRKILDGAGSD